MLTQNQAYKKPRKLKKNLHEMHSNSHQAFTSYQKMMQSEKSTENDSLKIQQKKVQKNFQKWSTRGLGALEYVHAEILAYTAHWTKREP